MNKPDQIIYIIYAKNLLKQNWETDGAGMEKLQR